MLFFLEKSGERLYLGLLKIREEDMSKLRESDGEEVVELSDVAKENFKKEEEEWDKKGVLWSHVNVNKGPKFLFSRGSVSPSEDSNSM